MCQPVVAQAGGPWETAFSGALHAAAAILAEHAQQAEEQQRLCCGSRGPDAVHAQHRRQKEQKQGACAKRIAKNKEQAAARLPVA